MWNSANVRCFPGAQGGQAACSQGISLPAPGAGHGSAQLPLTESRSELPPAPLRRGKIIEEQKLGNSVGAREGDGKKGVVSWSWLKSWILPIPLTAQR